MHEATVETTEHGRVPVDGGWCILNLAEVPWKTHDGGGAWSSLEPRDGRWQDFGAGVHVLWPGDAPGMYHAESTQEGFLVLSGECVAVVEGQERRMGPWDYLHCPPGTNHITVGAGDGPCAIFMVGRRSPDRRIHYPADPVAARHGASVTEPTDSPREAYADRPPIRTTRSPWPLTPSR